jgi:hypothetical protein
VSSPVGLERDRCNRAARGRSARAAYGPWRGPVTRFGRAGHNVPCRTEGVPAAVHRRAGLLQPGRQCSIVSRPLAQAGTISGESRRCSVGRRSPGTLRTRCRISSLPHRVTPGGRLTSRGLNPDILDEPRSPPRATVRPTDSALTRRNGQPRRRAHFVTGRMLRAPMF